jgi:transketolase
MPRKAGLQIVQARGQDAVDETADALVNEGQSPTVVSVRTRLGGGSPNTIAPWLSEWKALNETRQAAGLPPVPDPVEAVLRQVWGVAWKEAQGQLETARAALGKLREEVAKERAEMLAEIGRLDGELEAAREDARQGREALEAERHAHEQTKSDARRAHAVADQALTALRVEAATLTERAAHVDELRAVLKTLQEREGRGEGTGRARRRSKPEE